MNTLVIASIHRTPLITPYIGHLNPIVSLTPDYPMPACGHCRCFRGHTNALKAYMTDETALVFEDDCKVDESKPWKEVIVAASDMVASGQFEILCLHGRGFDFRKFIQFPQGGFNWLKPNTRDRWVLGTLVYVIGKKAAKQFIDNEFYRHGTNIDVFLWSYRFDFALLDPRQFVTDKRLSETLIAENPPPFIHGHGAEGSVLQNPHNTQYINR